MKFPSNLSTSLAGDINQTHEQAQQHTTKAIENAFECGVKNAGAGNIKTLRPGMDKLENKLRKILETQYLSDVKFYQLCI